MGKNRIDFIPWEFVLFFLCMLIISILYYYNVVISRSIIDIFVVIVSMGVFIVGWLSRKFGDNSFFPILGISFLFIGILNSVYTLLVDGTWVFNPNNSNLPVQLTLVASFIQAFSLLFALFAIHKKIRYGILFGIYAIITPFLIASIIWEVFPLSFTNEEGLKIFNIVSEIIIISIFGLCLILFYKRRSEFEHQILLFIVVAVCATICSSVTSEVNYVFSFDEPSPTYLAGHIANIIAYYLFYKAIVVRGIETPYTLLFQRVKQGEDKLAAKAEELERSNKDLENFAYIASHDLQQPLRTVAGFLELLGKGSANQLDEEAKKYIAAATRGAMRMKELIDDLLEYSRISTKGVPFTTVDFELLLSDALSDLHSAIEESGATITHDPLPMVAVDGTQMKQVFVNLVGNAIKFRGNNVPQVHISASRQAGEWVFSVRDNGIGIDMTQVSRLFNMFQRLHTREEYPGTGIGLAFCKRIIERHGGRIRVESEVGKGATFFFSLPAD
ncbi:MAG TPA: MASE3 domain-containing protein [Candidatus Lokiarchaeia archaeon]|nr:MASE3 domain-containing protein [Candidatus Lokiarchaeia archaeon]